MKTFHEKKTSPSLLAGISIPLLCAATMILSGCLTDDGDEKADVSISNFKVTPATVNAGQSVDVEGTVTSEDALSEIRVNIMDGDMDVTSGEGFTVTQTDLGDDDKAWSLKTDGTVEIAVNGSVAVGEYTVKVTARSGNDSTSATTTLTVTGTEVNTEEITLGSNQNAIGGSVDLDNLTVYTHADAKAVSETIDLYYAHSATGGDKLFTPAQAKVSEFGATTNGPATWDEANETEFRKLDLSESAFADITTQEAIDNLWATGDEVTGGGDEIEEGSTYIVNTDMAKKVLIRVTEYVPGDAGTITVKASD